MPDCRSKLGSCVEPGLHTSLLRSFPTISDPWGQDLRNYPPPPSHCPYQPRLAKCQAPSLGSLISHRPGPALNHPSSPHALSKCPPVTSTSPPGPSLTPHLLTHLPSLNFALCPQFPPLPNSSLLRTPQLPLLAPAFSQALSQPSPAPHLPPPTSPLSASSTWDSLSSLPSPPFRPPNSSPSPALFTPVPCPLDQPEHLLGRGGASSSPGGRRAAGQRPLAVGVGSATQLASPPSWCLTGNGPPLLPASCCSDWTWVASWTLVSWE